MEDFIKEWSKTTGKPEADLSALLAKVQTDLETSGIKDERILKIEFVRRLRAMKWVEEHGSNGSTIPKKKPVSFFGFFLGTTRCVDTDDFKRRKAMKAFREDSTQAQLMGLTDEAGTALDNRPTLKGRKGEEIENPNYHKPLIGHTWTRTVFGVALKEGGAQPMFFRMQLWRNTAKTFKYKPFVPIQFSAMLRNDKNGFMDINPIKSTVFQVTTQEIPIEMWIRKTTKIYALSDLDKAHAVSRDSYDRWIFTEGNVERIDMDINPNTGSRSIILSDADNGFMGDVRVFIPGDFPLGFKEYSRVIALGETRKWKPQGADEERLSMEGFSIFPIPGKTVERAIKITKAGQPAEAEDEGPQLMWKD